MPDDMAADETVPDQTAPDDTAPDLPICDDGRSVAAAEFADGTDDFVDTRGGIVDGTDAAATDDGQAPVSPAPGRRVAAPRSAGVLPSLTSDESAAGWGDWREEQDDDDRLLREVPPHHGTY
jgi:hypothetical protein